MAYRLRPQSYMEQNALLSFWNELGRAFFVLKNVFEFGNQVITQFLGGANLFEFSRGVVFWISPSWKTDSMDETLQGI